MDRATLKIEGMSCGHCVAQVTRSLNALNGVKAETVEIGKAIVTYDSAIIDPARIEEAVTAGGYPAKLVPVQ